MIVITIISVIVITKISVAFRNIRLIIGAAWFVTTGGPAYCKMSWTVADLDRSTVGPEGVQCSAAVQGGGAVRCSVVQYSVG